MRQPNGRSAAAMQYRLWYRTREWARLRADQLAREPWCEFCLAMERRTPATVADHRRPHRGDARLFFDSGNLQSLCATHHDSTKARAERGGRVTIAVGRDGWPKAISGQGVGGFPTKGGSG
jgi:hypothetical protein